MTTIAFFNNKGGVGKTSLLFHLGWSLADQGIRTLMVDLDPQSNLTGLCLNEDALERLWVDEDANRLSIRGCLEPLVDGSGDISPAHVEELSSELALLPGDIRLSDFEQKLSDNWRGCLDRDPASFRIVSSLYRAMRAAARQHNAAIILVDVGPNLGAINRSSLISADFIVTPMAADLFSLQGLKNLGRVLGRWREEWSERKSKVPPRLNAPLPEGPLKPMGYVVMQPRIYASSVTRSHRRWLDQIPSTYKMELFNQNEDVPLTVQTDPYCLGIIKHYGSLMPLAQAAIKPIFHLTPADGAIGAHSRAALSAGDDFRRLATTILGKIKLPIDHLQPE